MTKCSQRVIDISITKAVMKEMGEASRRETEKEDEKEDENEDENEDEDERMAAMEAEEPLACVLDDNGA